MGSLELNSHETPRELLGLVDLSFNYVFHKFD